MLASTLVYEVHGQRSQGVTSTYHQLNTQTLPSGKVETSDLVIISDVSQMSRQTVEFLFTHLNGKLLVTSDPISFQLLSDWFEIIAEEQPLLIKETAAKLFEASRRFMRSNFVPTIRGR